MKKVARSIKGEMVDFDLLRMKQKMNKKPISADVKQRENFIISKRKRNSKRTIEKMLHDQEENSTKVSEALKKQKESKSENSFNQSSKEKIINKKRIIKKKK